MSESETFVADAAKEIYDIAYEGSDELVGTYDWKILDGLPEKGLKILSLGGGNGSDLWHVAAEHEVILLEASSSAVDAAKVHGIDGRLADLEQPLDIADESIDVVVCKDLFEHLVSPGKLMREVHRVIRKDGTLVVSVPNHFYLPLRTRFFLGKGIVWKTMFHDHTKHFDEWDYMHLRFFTFKGFERFLIKGGFRVNKRFWDFGTLAHYGDPQAFHMHMKEKYKDKPLTRKAKFYFYALRPGYRVFNTILPRALRRKIVSLAPGLACAGFYYHCKKQTTE